MHWLKIVSRVSLIAILVGVLYCVPSSEDQSGTMEKVEPRGEVLTDMQIQDLVPDEENETSFLSDPIKLDSKSPDNFSVRFNTTKGPITIDVTRAWSPRGADRFHGLVIQGYFRSIAFFRVIEGFMAQFGIHGDPKVNSIMMDANIQDDPVMTRNARGSITFAKTGLPNSRSVQFFINLEDNFGLDDQGFSPFGEISSGMEILNSLYSGYGEGAPRGYGPDQGRIQTEGNSYLKNDFPRLDYIESAVVLD
jgi:peptidyl-prolyl cis-trans isomerase A (cyclophilin A)